MNEIDLDDRVITNALDDDHQAIVLASMIHDVVHQRDLAVAMELRPQQAKIDPVATYKRAASIARKAIREQRMEIRAQERLEAREREKAEKAAARIAEEAMRRQEEQFDPVVFGVVLLSAIALVSLSFTVLWMMMQ